VRRPREKKPKRVSYELIPRASIIGAPMYAQLDDLVRAYHEPITDARIALAWCTSWKPDVDGRVVLGKCKKASDLDRELAAFDFVILLSRRFWRHEDVTDAQRTALLDHELCHATVSYDEAGEPVEDERGRLVYRIRKHDIEEFTDIVSRHGCYKADLERFAAALRKAGVPKFLPCDRCAATPGWTYVGDGVVRCACYVTWAEQRQDLQAV
jgi:hypothetical protein